MHYFSIQIEKEWDEWKFPSQPEKKYHWVIFKWKKLQKKDTNDQNTLVNNHQYQQAMGNLLFTVTKTKLDLSIARRIWCWNVTTSIQDEYRTVKPTLNLPTLSSMKFMQLMSLPHFLSSEVEQAAERLLFSS